MLLPLVLVGCAPKTPEVDSPKETPEEKQDETKASIGVKESGPKMILFEKGEEVGFDVVYPENGTTFVKACANFLFDKIVDYSESVFMSVKDDRLNPGATANPETDEILVGDTNRPESVQALAAIGEDEYMIRFNGHKLVVTAHTEFGVKYAVNLLCEKFADKDMLELSEDYTEVGKIVRSVGDVIFEKMKRGINICSIVDRTDLSCLSVCADAGFDHVRFPVNFGELADENNLLNEDRMKSLDNAVNEALHKGLVVIIDFHFWENLSQMETEQQAYKDTFLAVWTQLANRYKTYPAELCYEFLNEPNNVGGALTNSVWNALQMQAYDIVRAVDKDRVLFFSPTECNRTMALKDLYLPEDDNVMIDLHNYNPFEFTHQKVYDSVPNHIPYSEDVFDCFVSEIGIGLTFLAEHPYRAVVGEFSVSPVETTPEQIGGFLSDVTTYMTQNGLPWTYWEFDQYWAAYDRNTGEWKDARYGGLMGKYKQFVSETK